MDTNLIVTSSRCLSHIQIIANTIEVIVEVELSQEERVLLRNQDGIVGSIVIIVARHHILLDSLVAQTLRQNLERHAGIASTIESLCQAHIHHHTTVDVHVTRAVLRDTLCLDTLVGDRVDGIRLRVIP